MRRPEIQERIVKVELTYYRHTHKPDVTVRPDLFRLNKIPHKERLENFFIVLTGTDNSTATIVDLPSNDDALNFVNVKNPANMQHSSEIQNSMTEMETNDFCIGVWF